MAGHVNYRIQRRAGSVSVKRSGDASLMRVNFSNFSGDPKTQYLEEQQPLKPDVSILIVGWNTRDLLHDCLESIMRQKGLLFQYEIIVVDNASSDGSGMMVEKEYPEVKLISNKENVGFAAANNQGIKIAAGRYVLFLNPDTIILDGAIDKMIAWSDKHPDVGCAGCQVYETETRLQKTCFGDPSPLNIVLVETGLHRVFDRPLYAYWDRGTEKDVDVVSGLFLIIPRHVLGKVGIMDEAFFVYAEEADLCRRIRQIGLRCVFTPIARITHVDGGKKSTSQIRPRMYVQQQKSKLIYARKYYGLGARVLVKTIFIASQLFRFALFGLVGLISRDRQLLSRARLARVALKFHIFGTEPEL
jgi:GT2 family glycosyltransferase